MFDFPCWSASPLPLAIVEFSIDGWVGAIALFLLAFQIPATAILLSRLFRGLIRRPQLPVAPPTPDLVGAVSVVVPTLNEVDRLSPCLSGLSAQGYELREVTVVDSNSDDGTPDLVKAIARRDPRFRLTVDEPLPPGWVGRPWALHTGFLRSSPGSEWILGIDADTQPQPGLIAALVRAARRGEYDLISLSSRFILKSPGELWLQPALLITLIYRFGPPDAAPASPDRVMANGQCFLCRRSVLEALGGYTGARNSFCDDVTLARNAARRGFRVGFLDGSALLKVRMYDGFADTWEGWGRSLDLKDASSAGQLWADMGVLLGVQGLPLPVLLAGLPFLGAGLPPTAVILLGLNGFLFAVRVALCAAIAPSYDLSQARAKSAFWLSPLADPLAVLRLWISATRRPDRWRGRIYTKEEYG